MRRLVLVAVTALVLAASAGCGVVGLPFGKAARPAAVVSVFLTNTITPQQKQRVGDVLKRSPGVRSVVYVSHEQAYQRAKKVFKDKPELLKSLRPEDLPESYQARLADPARAAKVIAAVKGMPGVQIAQLDSPSPRPS